MLSGQLRDRPTRHTSRSAAAAPHPSQALTAPFRQTRHASRTTASIKPTTNPEFPNKIATPSTASVTRAPACSNPVPSNGMAATTTTTNLITTATATVPAAAPIPTPRAIVSRLSRGRGCPVHSTIDPHHKQRRTDRRKQDNAVLERPLQHGIRDALALCGTNAMNSPRYATDTAAALRTHRPPATECQPPNGAGYRPLQDASRPCRSMNVEPSTTSSSRSRLPDRSGFLWRGAPYLAKPDENAYAGATADCCSEKKERAPRLQVEASATGPTSET